VKGLALPKKEADLCTRCATCTAICPVSRVAPQFPGPKQAGPGVERHGQSPLPGDDWMDLCLGCRLCDLACPSGVNIWELNLFKRIGDKGRRRRLVRDWLLSHTYLFGAFGSRFSRLVNPVFRNPLFMRTLDSLIGIDRRNRLPLYASETFVRWFSDRRFRSNTKIAYFYGCQTNTNEVEVGKAVVKVLEKLGIETILPYQSCCGLPKLGICDMNGARRAGLKNTRVLLKTVRSGLEVIFSSSSCGLMIKHDYSRVLSIPGAEDVAAHVHDFFEYLTGLMRSTGLELKLKALPMKAAYFAPCHLKSLGIGLPALQVLRMIPEMEIHNLETNCCGLGGSYGFKKEKARVSADIGEDLAEEIAAVRPALVISDCEGCRIRIRQLTGLKVVHPAQVLARVFG
jgi:glycerol-3-phosphate dehydrogenase subunit C